MAGPNGVSVQDASSTTPDPDPDRVLAAGWKRHGKIFVGFAAVAGTIFAAGIAVAHYEDRVEDAETAIGELRETDKRHDRQIDEDREISRRTAHNVDVLCRHFSAPCAQIP